MSQRVRPEAGQPHRASAMGLPGRPDDRLRETHHLQPCNASAVTNHRRNFFCGGSFFFTANLAERRLHRLVDDIDAADNRSRFGEPLDLQMDQSAFPAASRLRPTGGGLRRSLSSAPRRKFAALVFHVLLELP